MILRTTFILLLTLIGGFSSISANAQDLQSLKPGVVRIFNPTIKAQGTGFIIHMNADRSKLYILTASHVVDGAENPDIYFFNRNEAVRGRVINREEDELKGLALLVVDSNAAAASGLISLRLGESTGVQDGAAGHVIGFPSGTAIPTIAPANIGRREGRSIVFSGAINPGNSGGPLLANGKVIGLVTDVTATLAYATPTESINLYIGGLPDVAGALIPAEANRTLDRITILVADFRRKDQKNDGVTETILNQLRSATRDYSDVQIQALGEHISVEQGGDVARARGKERNASIVMWGGYNTAEEEVVLNVNFEVLQRPRGLDLSSEIETLRAPIAEFRKNFNVQTRLSGKMAFLTLLATGLARLEADDYDGAISRFTSALAQPDTPSKLSDRADIYFYRARAYLLRGLFSINDEKARINALSLGTDDINKYISIQREDADGYLIRGFFYMYQGNQEGSFSDSNKAIELEPQSFKAYMLRGSLYMSKADTDKAISSYNRAIQLMGDDADPEILYFTRGTLHMLKENYEAAIADFTKLIKSMPDSPLTSYCILLRGVAYAEKGDLDDAIDDFNHIIKMEPDNPAFYYARGHAYNDNANYVGAVNDYTQAISIMNGKGGTSVKFGDQAITLTMLYQDRADAYESLGNYDKAIEDLKQVIQATKDPSEREEAELKIKELSLKKNTPELMRMRFFEFGISNFIALGHPLNSYRF